MAYRLPPKPDPGSAPDTAAGHDLLEPGSLFKPDDGDMEYMASPPTDTILAVTLEAALSIRAPAFRRPVRGGGAVAASPHPERPAWDIPAVGELRVGGLPHR